MRERLLAAVHARLARFSRDNDIDAVLSQDALKDVAGLLATVPVSATDLEVLHAAGWLHWCRYISLNPGDNEQDLAAALHLFAPLYQQYRDAIPDPVRQYLASSE